MTERPARPERFVEVSRVIDAFRTAEPIQPDRFRADVEKAVDLRVDPRS